MSAPTASTRGTAIPDGYERFVVGRATAVVLRQAAGAVHDALRAGTLYEYAAGHPEARQLMGRAPAYAVPLPGGGERVVVRHSLHGGLLAPLTGDRFLPPTRAPYELTTALRLSRAGVPTPGVVAYVVYPAGPLLRTADVATREVVGGRDLVAVLGGMSDDPLASAAGTAAPKLALVATARLLRALAAAGARHPDLNAKNVLLAPAPTERTNELVAHVLDVDRIVFDRPHSPRVAQANLARLARSLRKWSDRLGRELVEDAILELANGARTDTSSRPVHA